MILPARPLIITLSVWTAAAVAASFMPALLPYWLAAGVAIVLWALVDLLLLWRLPPPSVARTVDNSLPLGIWSPVMLRLQASGRTAQRLHVFDHYPSECEQTGLPATLTARPGKLMQVKYRIQPNARGDLQFGRIELRMDSPWRAWQRQGHIGEAQQIKVYPNFAPLARHALQATDRHAPGMLKRRRRGQGMDFEQLREYREGDSLRQIDWKASTRMGKIISREYQDERDQRILLMVDCGRRMAARDGALSHFDHVLNAVLLLGYVGLRHGDSVGLITLGGPERLLTPQRSASTVSKILNTVYDLQPTLQSSDFERAAQQLMKHERKRSLVVLFTNLRDEDDQTLLTAARLMGERHLVLIASLREGELDAAQRLPVRHAEDAGLRAAATAYRAQRDAVLARLRANGVLCLDVPPQDLAVDTVNRYLAIKAAGRL